MSIKQTQFSQHYEDLWSHFEQWLNYLDAKGKWYLKKSERPEMPEEIDLPHSYRQICHHLALAKSRMYSPVLIERLNRLVVRGHQRLYGTHNHFLRNILEYFTVTFPSVIRKEWRVVLLSSFLFYGPFFTFLILLQFNPDLVYSVMDGNQVRELESMYDPDLHDRFGREREADSDIYMFGFYIKNNTGIGFQVFAGGITFGVLTLFFLLFNGLFIGAAAGHLTQIGYTSTFWSFVATHSALELTAIVFAGAAGLKLATALWMPGRKTRIRALIDNSKIGVNIIYGTATMFIMAAFVEAFWSSIAWMPPIFKYMAAAILWALVFSYFLFMGRHSRAT